MLGRYLLDTRGDLERDAQQQAWLYAYNPGTQRHGKPAGLVIGNTVYDFGKPALTIFDGVAYDPTGRHPKFKIVGDWFYDYETNEPTHWVSPSLTPAEDVAADLKATEKFLTMLYSTSTTADQRLELCQWVENRNPADHVRVACGMMRQSWSDKAKRAVKARKDKSTGAKI